MTKENYIILAAGKPHHGEKPAILTQVNGQSLFDWQINAIAAIVEQPQVVIGYAAEEVKQLSQRAVFCTNGKWQTSGSGYSLLSADLTGTSVITSYADILFRPQLLELLKKSTADITIVFDSQWKQRFVGRTEDDLIASEKVVVNDKREILSIGQNLLVNYVQGEFIGLVRFQGNALDSLRIFKEQLPPYLEKISLSGLVELLRLQGFSTLGIDVQGDWAELKEPKDIAHFILGTKAETLERLSGMVQKSIVLEQVAFTVSDWNNDAKLIMAKIRESFNNSLLVVRSSAKSEDAFTHSNAGAYHSVLNVNPIDELDKAIHEVIYSYENCQLDDQVLIQPMVQSVKLSGVAFTQTLDHGSPFYVINYDESGDTESITSGYSKQHKSLYLRKDADLINITDDYLIPLVEAIKEVEDILNYDALDIEFALDKQGKVYLLQVRPIVAGDDADVDLVSTDILELQSSACNYWSKLQTAAPHIHGDKALFGVMPDWNPAEIIGTNPGRLAVSLYEELILNDIWAQQRAEYGYKDVRPQPLLRLFTGKPYIDIRASFNSFLPANLSEELSQKLINFYLSWLENNPHLHDKVEFDVIPTCFGPQFDKWEARLKEHTDITAIEIQQLKSSLLNITQQGLLRTRDDLQKLTKLQSHHEKVLQNKNLANSEKIRLLIEYCKTYGTLPFAHLARAGFVAATLLKEGVSSGILSVDARDGFMETVATVSHELGEDAWNTAKGDKAWDQFIATYGHLRPGTYDITSPAYRDDADTFLKPLIDNAIKPKEASEKVVRWHEEKAQYFDELRQIGLNATNNVFECFLVEAIEGREKSKFIFTRTLSAILDLIINEGGHIGLTTEELSNLPYSELVDAFNSNLSQEELQRRLTESSLNNLHERRLGHTCQLPPLLCKAADFSAFILTEEKPNYIGTTRITAPVVHLNTVDQQVIVKGCIVVIPQADPGYDWLFGQEIAGLITMYGGANSHMAIRSAEFGLPAAIGVGEQLYRSYNQANILELDPAGETIRVIH